MASAQGGSGRDAWLFLAGFFAALAVVLEVLGTLSSDTRQMLQEFNDALYGATAQLNTWSLAKVYSDFVFGGGTPGSGVIASPGSETIVSLAWMVTRVFAGFPAVLLYAFREGLLHFVLEVLALAGALPITLKLHARLFPRHRELNFPDRLVNWGVFGLAEFLISSVLIFGIQGLILAMSRTFGLILTVASVPLALAGASLLVKWIKDIAVARARESA